MKYYTGKSVQAHTLSILLFWISLCDYSLCLVADRADLVNQSPHDFLGGKPTNWIKNEMSYLPRTRFRSHSFHRPGTTHELRAFESNQASSTSLISSIGTLAKQIQDTGHFRSKLWDDSDPWVEQEPYRKSNPILGSSRNYPYYRRPRQHIRDHSVQIFEKKQNLSGVGENMLPDDQSIKHRNHNPYQRRLTDDSDRWSHNTTSKGRWWLDTIAKLLHSHPITLDGHHRAFMSPVIDMRQSTNQAGYEPAGLLKWNHHPMISRMHRGYANLYGEARDATGEVGWRPNYRTQLSLTPTWMEDQLRKRISSYREWFSPRQWKQFMIGQDNSLFNLALFEAAAVGVQRAVAECRYQFRHERWNCSQVADEETALFGNILLKGIPQTAFVYSIINAGIVQSVAEACLGQIDNCPCNTRGRESADPDWQWQGCDHNIHYGRRFAHRLLDTMEHGAHIRFRMNLHNNKVGRQLVTRNMERYCRCHGTSGSCTLKTCYRRTPRMRKLGSMLKQTYDENAVYLTPDMYDTLDSSTDQRISRSQATELRRLLSNRPTKRGYGLGNEFRYEISPLLLSQHPSKDPYRRVQNVFSPHERTFHIHRDPAGFGMPSPLRYGAWSRINLLLNDTRSHISSLGTKLVYYESTSGKLFCEPEPNLNILGTRDRICNSTTTGPGSCQHLCCGRGFLTHHHYVLESCQCKFIWCCRVECRQCLVLKKVETCV